MSKDTANTTENSEQENRDTVVPYPYRGYTKKELRKLALESLEGEVYGSWDFPPQYVNNQSVHFLPLMFGLAAQLREMLKDTERWPKGDATGIAFYGDMKHALPRAINGLPCFHTCGVILGKDLKKLLKLMRRLHRRKQIALIGPLAFYKQKMLRWVVSLRGSC